MKTQKEFLAALRKERNGWTLYGGAIRRGNPRDYYCPITAVAKTATGTFHEIYVPRIAGRSIDMPHRLITAVIEAADTRGGSRLRKLMLQALRIKEN